ncbi:MAG: YqgE/AlgH family protein [Alkalispirochaeta sp.]
MATPDQTHPPRDLTGHFLIAETELQDLNFFRTVVLVIQHNEEGAFGLVVNRVSDVTVGDVIESAETSPIADIRVFVGGPVQQNYVFVLHNGIPSRYQSDHSEEVSQGVFFEPSFQHVLDYSRSEDYIHPPGGRQPVIHVFAGYSGWGPDQLERELAEDAWFIHPAQGDVVFEEDAQDGWKAALSKKGSFYRIVAETGYNPSMN